MLHRLDVVGALSLAAKAADSGNFIEAEKVLEAGARLVTERTGSEEFGQSLLADLQV